VDVVLIADGIGFKAFTVGFPFGLTLFAGGTGGLYGAKSPFFEVYITISTTAMIITRTIVPIKNPITSLLFGFFGSIEPEDPNPRPGLNPSPGGYAVGKGEYGRLYIFIKE
jgi:hypothetical protein